MAWTERLANGRYRGCYRDAGGRKRQVPMPGGFDYKSDAREAAQEAEVKARRQAAVVAGAPLSARMTWGEAWDLRAENRTFDDTDTGSTEASIVKLHLRPKWGHVPLDKITFKAIKDWVVVGELRVRADMSPAYVHRIFSVFNGLINWALDEEILTASPCAGIKLPHRPKKPKPYLATRTASAMGEHLREDYRDALDFDLETALRPGELCGLHADRLDLDRGWMLVAEVFVKRRRLIRPFPKDEDVRMVPLTDEAIAIARRRLDGRDLGAGCGVPHSDGSPCSSVLVFQTLRGGVMHPDTIGWHMKNAARKAGVERRSPYAGRRGAATRMAEGGLDAFQIAEILGHSTLTQAQEYVQQTPAARMKLATALARYPQLTVIEGGAAQVHDRGADQDHGARQGAGLDNAPHRAATPFSAGDTG